MNWITPFRLAPGDRSHARAVQMALVRELYHRSRIPLAVQLAAQVVFCGMLWRQIQGVRGLLVPAALLVALTLARLAAGLAGDHLERTRRRPMPRFLLFFWLAFASGLVFTWILALILPALSPGWFLLLALGVVGLSCLGCTTMAGSPFCYGATVFPSLVVLAWVGVTHPPFGMGSLLAVASVFFILTLAAASLQAHHGLFSTVLLTLRLEDMALRDPLTGLRNRRYLQEFMQEETPRVLRRWLLHEAGVVNRRSISLILVDLDLFKQVNDTYGHPAGDAVLLQVSQLLKEIVRKPDLVLRWGGEEFLILALDSDRTAPPLIAVRVHERMASHEFVLPGGRKIRQTCSVGYAIYPFHPDRPEGLGWEEVFRLADQSLYIAKDLGRNQLQGILPGSADPDAIVAALSVPDPNVPQALDAGLIKLL